jgi:hypothetical protein
MKNTNLKFAIVTTLLAGLLTACPTPPPAPVVSSITVANTLPDNNIKMNVPLQLTATALDANGTAIPSATFTWVSSNPDAITVDSTGLVTGKKFGSATITVSSGAISVASAPIATYGFEATFGTWASGGNNAFGTVRLYRFRVKTGQTIPAQTNFSLSMTGPTGWNNNAPATANCGTGANAQNAIGCEAVISITPVSGNYQISTTYSNETFVSQSVPVDISAPLGRPTITIASASTSAVTANWTVVPDAVGYSLQALNNSDNSSNKTGSFTTTTSATLTGLTLDAAKNPRVWVNVFNFDKTAIQTTVFPSNAKFANISTNVTIPTP